MPVRSTTVDIEGAAQLMNIHARTAEKLVVRGILPAARIGRAYVLMERDVLAYIEEQVACQTAQKRERGGRQGKTKTAVAAGLGA